MLFLRQYIQCSLCVYVRPLIFRVWTTEDILEERKENWIASSQNSCLYQSFPQFITIHTVKGFGVVNKAEIDLFLDLSCFFDDPADVGNLISGSSDFSKTSLNIWKFKMQYCIGTWNVRSMNQGKLEVVKQEMATHSSTLAWKIPWTEEPDSLQTSGSQRVRHNWATSRSLSEFFTVYCDPHSQRLWHSW